MAKPLSIKNCQSEIHSVLPHRHGSVHSDWTRNRNPVPCAACDEVCVPGEAYRVYCKRHKHVIWLGCAAVASDEMSFEQLMDEVRSG